jgi:hypothetical protein
VQSALAQVVTSVAAPAPGALTDIYSRAAGTFRLSEEGQIIAVGEDGNELMGQDGKPLTMKEFVTDLTKNAPYLFERSAGGGAQGGGQKKSTPGVRSVPKSDASAVGHNLEAIAKGEVTVDLES